MKRSSILLLFALLVFALPANAQTATPGGLSVSLVFPPDTPTQSYFSYKTPPGASQEGAVDLQNNGKQSIDVDIYAADAFNTADGALTGPLLGETSKSTGTWLTLDTPKVTLAPGQSRRIKFKMTVPTGLAAGDYFSFIFVQPSSAAPGGPNPAHSDEKSPVNINVKVVQRLGICIWERVPGALQNGLTVGGVKKLIDKGRLFLELELANTGNTYLKPIGTWALKSPGGEVFASQVDSELGYLLPGHPMKLRIPVQTARPLARGAYKLEYTIRYADQKLADQQSVTLP